MQSATRSARSAALLAGCLLLLLLMTAVGSGCEKTIHEAAADAPSPLASARR